MRVENSVNTDPLKSRCSSFAPCIIPRLHSQPLYAQIYKRPNTLAIKCSGRSEGVRQPVMDFAAAGTDLSDSISKVRRFNHSYRRRFTQYLCFYHLECTKSGCVISHHKSGSSTIICLIMVVLSFVQESLDLFSALFRCSQFVTSLPKQTSPLQ